MKTHILPAIKLTLICLVFFSGIYTLAMYGIAQLAPNHGKGITIHSSPSTIHYKNIGQSFTKDEYFQSRPSAVAYNAAGSGGSNKGPSNPEYLQTVQARIDTFLIHNPGIKKEDIPADMVTASGSGLDPDISVQGALVQVPRIAHVRRISEEKVKELVAQHTEKPLWSLLGPEKINVLQLNIALNNLK